MADAPISELELHAFIDGELGDARASEVAAAIAADADLAARVAAFRRDKAMLAQILAPLAHRPLPLPLRDRIAAAARRRSAAVRARATAAFAAAAAIALAVLVGDTILANRGPEPLVAEALAAREGRLVPESRIAASAMPTPAERDALVASNLAVPVKVPDLRKAGYELTTLSRYSGRQDHPAFELTYRNPRGDIFTVYLSPPTGQQDFNLLKQGAFRICVWQTEELSAVMVGEMSTDEMLRIASLTYADLNF
jgi:anti-sigma factor RsiW